MTEALRNTLAEVEILSTAIATHQSETEHLARRRRAAIQRARTQGAMLEEIAQAAGITRQRVWQLLDEETNNGDI